MIRHSQLDWESISDSRFRENDRTVLHIIFMSTYLWRSLYRKISRSLLRRALKNMKQNDLFPFHFLFVLIY